MSGIVTERAYAKLNLYLHITGKRADGYHLLDTLMVFAEAGDMLRAEPYYTLQLEVSGPFAAQLQGGVEENLVIKAARALQRAAGVQRGAKLVLTKELPVASGIGGGSADAAAVLRALNALWGLNYTDEALEAIARGLGSDVAACVKSVPARARGIGEKLQSAAMPEGVHVLLVNPLVPVATAEVYRRVMPPYATEVPAINAQSVEELAEQLHGFANNLEPPAREIAPGIGEVLEVLGAQPHCLLARMSGSGATCFGLFAEAGHAEEAAGALRACWPEYWIQTTQLRDHYADEAQ